MTRRNDDPTEFNPNGKWSFRRAWLYSGDEHSDKPFSGVDPLAIGYTIMPVHETRSYSPPRDDRESQEERVEREGRFATALAKLTDTERDVLKLQGRILERVEQRIWIIAGQLVEYQRNGYTLIPGSAYTVEREGLPAVEVVEVYGYEVIAPERLDYETIGERLSLSVSQVHRAVKGANRKMRGL